MITKMVWPVKAVIYFVRWRVSSNSGFRWNSDELTLIWGPGTRNAQSGASPRVGLLLAAGGTRTLAAPSFALRVASRRKAGRRECSAEVPKRWKSARSVRHAHGAREDRKAWNRARRPMFGNSIRCILPAVPRSGWAHFRHLSLTFSSNLKAESKAERCQTYQISATHEREKSNTITEYCNAVHWHR